MEKNCFHQFVPGVCSFCWNITERQILWSLCSVDFHTLTLQLSIQTPHFLVLELQVCVSSLKISAKRAHPCCLYLAEVTKKWILIKFWTEIIYEKVYDYFPVPNYSWTNGIFLWIVSCKNYFCTWQNFSKFRKKNQKSTSQAYPIIMLLLY